MEMKETHRMSHYETRIELGTESMVVLPVGWARVWSLRSAIIVPRGDVVAVGQDPRLAQNGPRGLRFPGTNLPGAYLAGTYWRFWGDPAKRERSFWIRRHPDKCIRIELRNHAYDYLMIEVDDPAAEIARIEAWLRG
jgi:hypothetical protein